jgi:HEAT repeat protein
MTNPRVPLMNFLSLLPSPGKTPMKTWLILATALALAAVTLESNARAAAPPSWVQAPAQAEEEKQLLSVLQSGASLGEKDAACARLKAIGTDSSVPALAALLTDAQLSHSARYALEGMSSAKAGKAIAAALDKTSGTTKVGIINSLEARREADAIPKLATLLDDKDAAVAVASARALGRIGGPKALAALQKAGVNRAAPVHNAVVDATLRCATGLVETGGQSQALEVFQHMYETESADGFRMAAYRGMILASEPNALPLITRAITDKEGPVQVAALQMVHEVRSPGATEALVRLLPSVDPVIQVALIEGLSQRGDPAAASAVVAVAGSANVEVRLAALNALGWLGDASIIPLLANSAATTTGPEQAVARLSLVQLRRGNPSEVLLAQIPGASAPVQAELARALGDRGETVAIPRLLELARGGADSARQAALQALATLAGQPQLASLVLLVRDAKTADAREQAADTLSSVCRNIKSRQGTLDVEPITQELAHGSADTRVALFPVCSTLKDPKIRDALRQGVADTDPRVRAAAVRALCDTTDPELSAEVLKLAREAKEENFRTLAIRACVRLATQEESAKLSNAQRLEPLQAILATPLDAAQRRIVLSGLADVPDVKALKLVEPFLDDEAVRTEAAQATVKLASVLPFSDAETTMAAFKKVAATTSDPATRQSAEKALKGLEKGKEFITTWQFAGPYLQEGKDYAALFDIVFPPEADGKGVNWQPLAPAADPKQPWVMDLLKAIGGEQRVAYARTWIHADQTTPARLELGTDDGVKVWLNQRLVHAHNTFRALQPGSDKVNVTLNAGWNLLLLKVTQLNQGWGFCARLITPDGQRLEGLKYSTEPKAAARN